MKCAISAEQQKRFRTKVAGDLFKAVSQEQPFDLKEYMRLVYNKTMSATNDHAKAIDYTRLVPFFIQQVAASDIDLGRKLRQKGMSMDVLMDLVADIADEQKGVEATEKYIAETVDIVRDLAQDNVPLPLDETPVVEETPVPIIAETVTPITRQPFTFSGQQMNDFLARNFKAFAPTALSDAVLEAPWNKEDPNYNVPFPDQVFYFKVKRSIISRLREAGVDYNSENLNLGDFAGPLYLTAMSSTQIDPSQLRDGVDTTSEAHQKGVVLVLTDKYGTPLQFDENGNHTYDRARIAYYMLRATDRVIDSEGNVTLTTNDRKSIKALAQQRRISESAAEDIYVRELKLIADIRKYVNENPSQNRIVNKINGGTMGYIQFDFNVNTPIKAVNFGNETFRPYAARVTDESKGEVAGRTYFTVDDMYGQLVEIERPTIEQTGMADTLASLILDNIVDRNGVSLSPLKRQSFVDTYIETRSDGVRVFPDPNNPEVHVVKLQGETLSTSPDKIEESRKKLVDFFNKIGPAREIKQSEIGSRQIIKTTTPNYQQQYGLNKVLEVVNTGQPSKYYVIEKQKLHIKRALLTGNFTDISLAKENDGTVTMKTSSRPYKDFVKDNFLIHYPLNTEGKLVKLNAYFTFQPVDESFSKLYPQADAQVNTELKNVEEITAPQEPLTGDGPADSGSVDSSLDAAWDGPEFFKVIDQKDANLKATKEQIAQAKVWYENHSLSKHIPFEIMFHAINTKNPRAIASWALHGITLYRGSDFSDLYHEAWHAFSQTFLTKEQKRDLYNEVRKKSGNFMDLHNKRVTFASATDFQLEEYLAEDFRGYMLNGKKTQTNAPVRNSLFKKILNMLEVLFGFSTTTGLSQNEQADKTINDLYEKLRVGNLSEYTFSQENVQFGELNTGIQAWAQDEQLAALNYENSRLVVETIDSLFAEFIDLMNAGLSNQQIVEYGKQKVLYDNKRLSPEDAKAFKDRMDSIKSKNTFKYSSQIFTDPVMLRGLYKHAQIRMAMIHNVKHDLYTAEENPIEKARMEKDLNTLHYVHKNFGDTETLSKNVFEQSATVKGVIGYHMRKSSKYFEDAMILDFENMSEEDTFLKGREGYDRMGNETSMQDLAKKEILYLLKSLHKLDKKGNVISNKFGVAELANFNEVWNRLAKTLQNTPDPAEMERKLLEEAKVYPVFKQLLGRLGPLATQSAAESTLWTNFWQTFNLTRVPLIQMTLEKSEDPDGKISYTSRIGEAFADYRKVGKRWLSEFHTTDASKSKYVDNDRGGNYLNIDTILNDFQVDRNAAEGSKLAGRELEFFRALGFKMTDVPEVRKALAEGVGGAQWYRKRLLYLKSRGDIQVRNFSDLNKAYQAFRIGNNTFEEKADLNTRFKALQQLESRYSQEHSNFMVTNAEGNTQFEHSLNNTLTMMVNTINNSKSYQDLISKPHMAHLNMDRNPQAKASTWLKSLYNLDENVKGSLEYGQRRRRSDEPNAPFVEIHLTNLSGVLLTEEGGDTGDGIASARADEFTKLILDFHLTSQVGVPELMRHSDKGTSYSAVLDKIMTPFGVKSKYIENFEFLSGDYHSAAYELMLPHIQAEVDRIITMKQLKEDGVENFDFKYLERGQDFVAFDDVLRDKTKSAIMTLIDADTPMTEYLETDRGSELRKAISDDIQNYFAKQVEKVALKLARNEFIADNLYKDVIGEARNKGLTNITRSQAKDALIKSFVYNSWFNNIETVSLIYGDLAQYEHTKEEFHKRNAGAGSTGRIYRTDNAMQEYVNHSLGRKFAQTNGIAPKAYTGLFDTAVVEDNNIGSAYYKEYLEAIGDENAAKAYSEGKMNEGDAQGWITFDAYRILKTTEGTWTKEQESLYNDIVNKKRIDPKKVLEFFPAVKAQYFGPLKTDGLPITAFHKFSLFPLIPSVIEGTNLANLHTKMMQEDVDYALFESGSKVGTVTKSGKPDKLYSKGRELSNVPFTKNTIFLEYLKDQLEIAPEYKGNVIFSTQLRKLIEDGLYENGKPISSEAERLVKIYEENIRELTTIKKKQLLREANWTMTDVNGKQVLEGNMEDLMKFVKFELSRQDLADHQIDFIQVMNGKIKHDLSLSLSSAQIEKLLNAIVTKRLVKQKVNGEGLIQVSGALFEKLASTKERDYKNPTEEQLKKWGTNDLPTYHKGANGKTQAMKVKIALQGDFMNLLQAEHIDDERIRTLDRLNEMLKNEAWLNKGRNRQMITMVGVRIPVQGLNSMEFMEVYEFLPTEAGNIIIPPAEIVAKSGSDFDIDKLSVMMPNIKRGTMKEPARLYNYTESEMKELYEAYKLGKVEAQKINTEDAFLYNNFIERVFGMTVDELEKDLEELLMETGEIVPYAEFKERKLGSKAVENNLMWNIKEILEIPENYKNLIRPNDTDIVKPIADKLSEYVMDFDPKDVVNGERRTAIVKGKKQEVISPTRVFEVEYNLYKHSSNNIGKQTLGLGAVDNTYNTVFNRIGARMNPTAGTTTEEYNRLAQKKSLSKAEQKKVNNYHRQTLFFPHNTLPVSNEKAISLSHNNAKDGNRISDVISQLINGWVDIAKDTWIFNIQGNKEIAPSLLFMIQAGVPVEQAIYFVSMPMVRHYVNEQRLAKSTFAEPLGKAPENPMFFRIKARTEILSNPMYGFDLTRGQVEGKLQNSTVNKEAISRIKDAVGDAEFDKTMMFDKIKDYSKKTKAGEQYVYSDFDRAAFLHFLEVENMSRSVRDIKLKMNFDTTRSGNLFEAQNRILMKETLRDDARIPAEIIDNILENSPIGSFYIQPFQLEIWKGLFTLRNHPMLNKYLMEKIAFDREAVRNTFEDPEKFANEFRNDFVNFIFQNELRGFDINSKSYQGYMIDSETPVKRVTSLEFGAFVKEGVLYVDKNQLKRDYKNKNYTNESYTEKGLAKVSSMAFDNPEEYYHFVYERERLRSVSPFAKVKDAPEYIAKRNVVAAANLKKTDESAEDHGKRVDGIAYEEFLRDTALDNTYNHWKIFKSQNTYADEFNLLRMAYPEIVEDFALIKQLSIGTSKIGYTNLKLNDTQLDAETLNLFHENLITLMDPQISKIPDAEANRRISEFFSRFPTVAFLQSGMSTKSQFALTGLVPQDTFLRTMEQPVQAYENHLTEGLKTEKTPPILDVYYNAFVKLNSSQNRASRIRGKNYTSMLTLKGSEKMMKDGVALKDVIEPVEDVYLLQIVGGNLLSYNPAGITIQNAKTLTEQHRDKTFVYNFAIDSQANAFVKDHNFYGTEAVNVVGMPTRMKYAGANQEITDVDGNINPRVKTAIDDAVEALIQQKNAGQKLVFSIEGYGQYMLNTTTKNSNNPTSIAPQTFLYLSKRLFEEFGYINPNYLTTTPGKVAVQSTQPITDDMIKDFMNHCL